MSFLALELAVGAAFCVGGVLVLPMRERRTVAVLLLATGAAWLVGAAFPGLVLLYRGPLVQLLVSYPGRRRLRRPEQIVCGLGYLAAVAPIGADQWVMVTLAALVVATVIAGQRRASGIERRARVTSSAVGCGWMGILIIGSLVRLAGADVGPTLLVVFECALIGGAAVLAADARWGRWDRSAVTGLVVDLGAARGTGGVRSSLAAALSDPELVLGFLDQDSDSLVDEAGRPVRLPNPTAGRERTTLRDGGRTVAIVVHQVGALDDPALRESITVLIGLAVTNARLQAGLRKLAGEVESSRRRILEVTDRERRDLAAELAGTHRRLDAVDGLLGEAEPTLRSMVGDSRASLDRFARGVYPSVLAESGLADAVAELVRTAPPAVTVEIPPLRLPAAVEVSLYFVCAEALTNVAKHASGASATVSLSDDAGIVRLTIADDGPGGVRPGQPDRDAGTGLAGLADRMAVIGGSLTIVSPPGGGTSVTATLRF